MALNIRFAFEMFNYMPISNIKIEKNHKNKSKKKRNKKLMKKTVIKLEEAYKNICKIWTVIECLWYACNSYTLQMIFRDIKMDRSLFSKPFMYRLLESCLTFRFFFTNIPSKQNSISWWKHLLYRCSNFFFHQKLIIQRSEKKAKRKNGIWQRNNKRIH